jgi:hypothetical protein
MKKISELQLGFADAENYKRRENKELLNKLFIRNEYLDKLCSPAVSFLVGEKGTGKTAYSVYLANNNYNNNSARVRFIRETEYQQFVTLRSEKHLKLSDYTSIWKVIICLLLSQQIKESDSERVLIPKWGRFRALQAAIDEYYKNAFAPEIAQAMQLVNESKLAAELISKHAKIAGEDKEVHTFTESRFQTNLFYILRKFQESLSQVKVKENHILFIDGIDIRPSSIPFSDYTDCIKGLANATWELNNDFFPTIRDSKGRLRVVLLIRPDIFESLGLQNQNTKIKDNSVFLDWRTDYAPHRTSHLFKVIDHILEFQQAERFPLGRTWDHYFPWNSTNWHDSSNNPTSFINFMRWSYYRPRDIITMLGLLQEEVVAVDRDQSAFKLDDFVNARFARKYSTYLLGEIKDHLLFYYSQEEYNLFLKFFQFLDGLDRFDYKIFQDAFRKLQEYIETTKKPVPQFMVSANDFLQFLYDLNVVCYIERTEDGKPFIHWCFRDRSYSNISPKVKTDSTYEVFRGLAKALDVGKKFTSQPARP